MQKGLKLPIKMKVQVKKKSLKYNIFINKIQENESANTLNIKFMFAWKKGRKGEKEIYFQHKQEKNTPP